MEDDFEQWFLANGGYINPNVEIASDTVPGRHMRVIHGGGISTDSLIVSCPHELTISWLNVIGGSERFLGQFALEEKYHEVNQVVIVRFFLLNEYLKAKESFWWPYIRSLPQPTSANLLGTPLYYEDKDWLWINGTNLESAAREIERMWYTEYDEVMQSLVPMDASHAKSWSWSLYKWAATIMSSRCFPASALANSSLMKRASGLAQSGCNDALEPGSPVLIPGIDLLNHRPYAKVTWQWSSISCRLVTNEDLLSGTQIWNNYGQKSNEELILGYGFSIADNPADHCGLAAISSTYPSVQPLDSRDEQTFSGGLVDQSTYSQHALRTRRNPVRWVRLRNSIVDKISKDDKLSFEFSPGFLNEVALALSNHRGKAAGSNCLQDEVNFSNGDISRVKLKVMATVTMIIQRQHSNIVAHSADLPQWPEDEKQFHAARYRRSQLHILRTVNASLLSTLSGLAGFVGCVARDTRIVRLEHMLLESPSPLLADFRAALNAGLGTRKAAKIRERGWVECAFTLWICGAWIWEQSASIPQSLAGLDFHSRIRQWLHFLRSTYSDTLTPHESPLGPNESGSAAVRVDQEDLLLVDSYFEVIRMAVQKNPQSLYNLPACTSTRMLWCLHIAREESVMCPSFEGKPGDDSDELVLFLECPGTC